MTSLVLQQLEQLEMLLRKHSHWQIMQPDASALASSQPFCLDTLEPLEWLQWILIPRLRTLIAAQQPLPQNFTIAPYYEEALSPATAGHVEIVHHLTQLDALFTGESV